MRPVALFPPTRWRVTYLPNREVGRHEVLLLVDRRDVGLVRTLADDLHEGAGGRVSSCWYDPCPTPRH